MSDDRFSREIAAYSELQKLLEHADEVRRKFAAAGIALPEPLIRLLGDLPAKALQNGRADSFEVHGAPQPPSAAAEDWIFVAASELATQQLTLAILRSENRAMRPSEVMERAAKINSEISKGGIYNVGPRLAEAGVISREDRRWKLNDLSTAPLLSGGFAWGPPQVFNKQEVASYRRFVIVDLLRRSPDGLMTMQIVRALEGNLGDVPVAKDLLKMDMAALQLDGKVRRFGRAKKWKVTDD